MTTATLDLMAQIVYWNDGVPAGTHYFETTGTLDDLADMDCLRDGYDRIRYWRSYHPCDDGTVAELRLRKVAK